MIRTYGKVIMSEIRRRNSIQDYLEDHYQEVIMKLISARVLEKFVHLVLVTDHEDKPETMTALEACSLLGIKFGSWRHAQYQYVRNFLGRLGGKLPADRTNDERGPFNVEGQKGLFYWVAWMPKPISGSVYRPNAVYKTSDVLDLHEKSYWKKTTFSIEAWPKREVEPHLFQAYLLHAVRNHLKNIFRSICRKHKDRPGDHFWELNDAEGEYNENWTDTLKDKTATEGIESFAFLGERLTLLKGTMSRMPEPQRGEILDLLNRNHSVREVIKLVPLSSMNKRQLLELCEA
jgi:hypothetical protein